MQVFLAYFNMVDICQKLQQIGLTNLDAVSHDWYQGVDDDDEIALRKKQYRQAMLSVLTHREFLALTYLLQFYEWEVNYLACPQGVV